ncbi:hypothetical protein E5676_scaffold263G00470 [Cucumis melo var. makuwa]|uniref:Uncharacterized protein n=1 Tax=Cucumis melo var. makuwa TaxID=1194695 RepID=A0A5D3CJX2_CUCMM|nr:hypothetical protein E6C27_scaffold19G00940 [Cucumis melo var. makuwa]TYK11602.1 hypothetical protein E5676_scaffold263G00470 [Cucumis melo var. makuwa]
MVPKSGELRFYMSESDSWRTTQNSGVMVIGESNTSRSGDNNFYTVIDDVLHVQYPMGRSVWLFKYRCNLKVVQVLQNKRIYDMPKVDDVENEQLNVLEIVVDHGWMNTSRMTLYAGLTLIPQSLKDQLYVM